MLVCCSARRQEQRQTKYSWFQASVTLRGSRSVWFFTDPRVERVIAKIPTFRDKWPLTRTRVPGPHQSSGAPVLPLPNASHTN